MLNRFCTYGALLLLVSFTLIACLPAFGFIPAANGLAIDARNNTSFFLDNEGALWSWGTAFGSSVIQNKPTIASLTNVSAVAGGPDYCTASKKDGSVWEW
ncbi:MAG: hypothetical protein PHU78_06735 [Heliobacteriaceae bacterium]|nr:hypothetical protein [Heliobacteriaceae bacterium]